ncbi:PEP-CTERM sorting domain-containing protein [Singulisphaera sp. PoT]|uniref:Npun_F0296 family exosortase-dependent surface protein n=1 Tax=Singulisphaera sp. PoT TaxID=3411797 RepID=UPI003BF466B4
MNRTLLIAALVILAEVAPTAPANAGLLLTAEDAGVQATKISNTTTLTFNSLTPGNYTSLSTSIGTITSPGLNIHTADVYGGAGGTGKYAAIGAESATTSATLTLLSPQSYFGFWWSAADAMNKIQFLSNGVEVGSFDPTSALGSLDSTYYGNPNMSGNSGEKYAYLNVFGTNGTTFDQVVFTNLNTGSGFESDNWSVRAAAVDPPYSGAPINGGITAVPEPSSIILTAIGALGMVGLVRQKRKAS